MTIQDMGAIGEIVGAIAIVISFLYLATQIKVANRNLELQAARDSSAQAFSAYDPIYDGRNAEIFRLGLQGNTEMSANDAFVFNLLMHRQVGALATIHEHYKKGLLTDAVMEGNRNHYRAILNSLGSTQWFKQAIAENSIMLTYEELAVFGIVPDE
jgi:hypothetical protein